MSRGWTCHRQPASVRAPSLNTRPHHFREVGMTARAIGGKDGHVCHAGYLWQLLPRTQVMPDAFMVASDDIMIIRMQGERRGRPIGVLGTPSCSFLRLHKDPFVRAHGHTCSRPFPSESHPLPRHWCRRKRTEGADLLPSTRTQKTILTRRTWKSPPSCMAPYYRGRKTEGGRRSRYILVHNKYWLATYE